MEISVDRIQKSIDQISCKSLDYYLTIQKELEKGKVLNNKELQDAFCNLYDSRHVFFYDKKNNENLKLKYFIILEKYHGIFKNTKQIEFIDLFSEIEKNIKKSIVYTSKMLHTIDNRYPIWDSQLVGFYNFNLNNDKTIRENKEVASLAYKNYCEKYENFMKSRWKKKIIKCFDEKFGSENRDYVEKINDVKKIDFVLWKNNK